MPSTNELAAFNRINPATALNTTTRLDGTPEYFAAKKDFRTIVGRSLGWNLIKSTAFLELKLVEQGPSTDKNALAPNGVVPPGMDLVEEKAQTGQRQPSWYLVKHVAVITGRDLKNARPSRGQYGSSSVTFFLTAAGAEKLKSEEAAKPAAKDAEKTPRR